MRPYLKKLKPKLKAEKEKTDKNFFKKEESPKFNSED
jgi:hypothetical protein